MSTTVTQRGKITEKLENVMKANGGLLQGCRLEIRSIGLNKGGTDSADLRQQLKSAPDDLSTTINNIFHQSFIEIQRLIHLSYE